MKYIHIYILLLCCILSGCSCSKENDSDTNKTTSLKKVPKFAGDYNGVFNDLHDLHIAAAKKNGIMPLALRKDADNMSDQLTLIPKELPYYITDSLRHSIPYLVPKASKLLVDICLSFRDSLVSKDLPKYKLVITSLTRTDEDIKKLTKRNSNASHNSAHCYGTTFDISWKRYSKINSKDKDISTDKLKLILGQVLNNYRAQEQCYIKHEKKQACFHITVR